MKMLSVKRNIIVLIFAVMLLICGVQGISYGQEDRARPQSHLVKSTLLLVLVL